MKVFTVVLYQRLSITQQGIKLEAILFSGVFRLIVAHVRTKAFVLIVCL